MTTKEFRKYLLENWNFEDFEDCFDILNLAKVYKKNKCVEFEWQLDLEDDLVSTIMKYSSTPIEERGN